MSNAATASRGHQQKHTKMPTSTQAQYNRHARKKPSVDTDKNKNMTNSMSLEAQIAMQLALEDSKKASKTKGAASAPKAPVSSKTEKARQDRLATRKTKSPRNMEKIPETRGKKGARPVSGSARKDSAGSSNDADDGVTSQGGVTHKPPRKTPSFKDLYEMHESMRMHRDITDINYDEKNLPRQALGGGKIENAMEIVEIVNADEPPPPAFDDEAIEELMRINSMEKVAIWMQATDHDEADNEPPDDLAPIPEHKEGQGKVKTKFSLGGPDSD